MRIATGLLDDPQVAALLRAHLAGMQADTPVENAHALGIDGLRHPAITMFTRWDGDTLLGMAALKDLETGHGEPGHGEVKSMRTAAASLRSGTARALLAHIVAEARARGHARLSLETGTAPSFAPANRLYETFGFADGPVFGGYPESPHNRFMTLML